MTQATKTQALKIAEDQVSGGVYSVFANVGFRVALLAAYATFVYTIIR